MPDTTTTEASTAPAPDPNSPEFLKAVTQLGARQAVVTAAPVYNQRGVKLIEGGVRIDASLYERLFSHRLAVPLDESMSTESAVTAVALREACEATMARLPLFALMGPDGRVRDMLLQSIEAIPLPPPIAFQLTVARETRPGLFEHGILMALLCAHLVREGGAPMHDMTTAASAGLLHDLGMLHIDAELLASANALSGDARRPLYVHPMTGSMLVARFAQYPKGVARAIFEHHEFLDGSGYPRGLSGEAISPLGRLLSLCEVVTAMFDGERRHAEQRVSLLLRINPLRFDATLVPSIQRLLRALPAGEPEVDIAASDSVEKLRTLAALLNQWHHAAAESAPQLDAAGRAVLHAVAEQAETLQRMLFGAGITPDQLGMLTESAGPDALFRAELWALTRELHWHLRSSANQLRRRWRASAGAQAFPAGVAAWLDAVEALEPEG
jgi:HD-GYP domain-containing protein (c-di-GMP phosphodiesterase class II)